MASSASHRNSQSIIESVQAEAKATAADFISVLQGRVEWGDDEWRTALGTYFHYPTLSLTDVDALIQEIGEPNFEMLSLTESRREQCMLWKKAEGPWVAILVNPLNTALQQRIERRISRPIDWHLVAPIEFQSLFARCESGQTALQRLGELGGHEHRGHAQEISIETLGDDQSAAIRIVNSTVYDALKAGASDIHLETGANDLRIKYRIDGVLQLAGEFSGQAVADQVVSRVKVMAELDITERRVPQDGRCQIRINARDIDFRVSVMPSVFGEDVVIRILDKEALTGQRDSLRLDQLGFDAQSLDVIRSLAREPYGMLLVTGPTGSGKTTTLYAALSEINDGQEKIVTIEDPVEYRLPGVLQIPVNEKKGLTFARGLRSILRHDPDKIMVGEIRDSETAEIAVQSALTGHLVLTTVHANNVFDVVGRFMHMGVDPYNLVSALNGIVAQRLVRVVCPACAREIPATSPILAAAGITGEPRRGDRFVEACGCGECHETGYRGRKAIAEFMVLDDELRDLIVNRAPLKALKAQAAMTGTRSLRQAALQLVQQGLTTLAEANRVTSRHEGMK